jgi:hypothetical protein
MNGRINHCVYNINYHIVFCPEHRHKVIKDQIEAVFNWVLASSGGLRPPLEAYALSILQSRP